MIEAAIIIPHYNDTLRLRRCLDALMPQMTAAVEIVVVDNGSSASLDPIRHAYPDLRLVIEPCTGAAHARNRGVAETCGARLFFLDSDCLPAPNWLAIALAISQQADLIGGAVIVFDETPPPRNGAQAFEAVFAFDNRAYIERKGFAVTANLLTRRDVFTATGPFVAQLAEDLDWCRRATAQGFKLMYSNDLHVLHPSRSNWPALRRKWRRLTNEAFAANGLGPFSRIKWTIKAFAMPASILAHLPKIALSPLPPAEKMRAALTLIRLRLTRMLWMLAQALGAG